MSKNKSAQKQKSNSKSASSRISGPRTLQTVSGFKDRLGSEQKWWGYYQQIAFEVMEKYNFLLVHPASVEYMVAYARAYGKNSSMVGENLMRVLDERGEYICLRTNMDLSFLRSYYLLHKQDFELGMPIDNWYTISSVFGENSDPREKLIMYMSVIGNSHPVVDAECTVAAFRYIQALGFPQIQVLVNSIGGEQSQEMHRAELVAYYKEKKKDLCSTCQKNIVKNPYQVLSCDNQSCKEINQQAPQSVDWLVEEDKEHFIRVLEYLDELEVPYLLAPELIFSDGTYQKTLVQLKVTTDEGTNYILAQGGRFDDLSTVVADKDIPAMKMTIDLDRCLTATRTQKLFVPVERTPQIFMAQLGDEAKKKSLALRELLHKEGIKTVEHFGQDSLKSQLEQAQKYNVKYTCILGQKEMLDGTILIRDMDGGVQEEIPINKLISELKKRLSQN